MKKDFYFGTYIITIKILAMIFEFDIKRINEEKNEFSWHL